jgi:hypothetical protein
MEFQNMSGTTGKNRPSYLPALFGPTSRGPSLLAAVNSYASEPVDPVVALDQAMVNQTSQIAVISADPRVKHDVVHFARALLTATSPAQLLADPVALKVLLTANGLGDQATNNSLATRVLLEDASQANSLVNHLSDPRWLAVNKTYAFATNGLAGLRDPPAVAAVTDRYAEVVWRASLDQETPGLANAVDFVRRASSITSADQIVDDPTLRMVVMTALGLSNATTPGTRSARSQAVRSRLDVASFGDPTFVRDFARRYLIAAGQQARQRADEEKHTARTAGLVV